FQQFNLVERLDVLTNVLIGRLAEHGFMSSMAMRFTDEERTMAIEALDRLDLFLMFWVRAWTKIDEPVLEELHRLRSEGLIRHFSLSTHDRMLAVEAVERGWDPIMSRHSAAHRGLETTILPAVQAAKAGLLTFSNLCYGRILGHPDALTVADPEPVEFYRYSLSHPGVTACWSAPATIAQLEHNLQALDVPTLPQERLDTLRAYGDLVYRDNDAFRRWVRER
ncbi:MAG: hypothetical protein AAFS10_06530, partial [Myxococcota bacterium]